MLPNLCFFTAKPKVNFGKWIDREVVTYPGRTMGDRDRDRRRRNGCVYWYGYRRRRGRRGSRRRDCRRALTTSIGCDLGLVDKVALMAGLLLGLRACSTTRLAAH